MHDRILHFVDVLGRIFENTLGYFWNGCSRAKRVLASDKSAQGLDEKMNGRTKHLVFADISHERPDRKKTKTFRVDSNWDGSNLGEICWHGPWRQYCFFPTNQYDTVWSHDCLAELEQFLNALREERKLRNVMGAKW